MGMDELILIGTGFVLARVLWVFYLAPRRAEVTERRDRT
jgi:hypothetical protein